MNIFYPFLIASIAGLSTILGALFIYIPIRKKDDFITFSLALSISVMILVSLFDLIPESLSLLAQNPLNNILISSCFLSIGIVIVYIINKIIEKGKGSSNLYKVGILNLIALIMHNLPEGILTFMSAYQDFKLGLTLCIAIALHNIPEGISIAIPIYYSTKSKRKAFIMTLLSSFAEPLGAILAYIILAPFITKELIALLLLIVSGIMITISIEKMLPEALSYKKKRPLIYGLMIGSFIVILSLFIL